MRPCWRCATGPMSSTTPPGNAASRCTPSRGIFLGCSRNHRLARWRNEQPPNAQRRERDRLEGQIERLRSVLSDILELAEELQQGTLERVLAKSDLELGIEALRRMTNER